MDQMIFWGIVIQGIAFVIFGYVMYFITKNAIRDGIKESQLVKAIEDLKPEEDISNNPEMTVFRVKR